MGFNFDIPDDLLGELRKMENEKTYEEVTSKMLQAGSEIVKEEWKNEMEKHKDTGSVVNSIKETKPKRGKDGVMGAYVSPTGTDEKGVRNIEKAIYLENGTCKQQAQPYLQRIKDKTEPKVIEAMQKEFDKIIGGN